MMLYTVFDAPYLAPVALILDYLLGDPKLPWPHPVVAIGRLYTLFEKRLRRLPVHKKIVGRLAGAFAVTVIAGLTGIVSGLLLLPKYLGPIAALYLAYAGLAMGSLMRTGSLVLNAIEEEPLPEARKKLSWLVSRETATMDRPCMRKTLADTLTENFTDALVAPFFWRLLTGPIGLWVYKAISTGDSMWGYTTDAWRNLGWACARADDCAAFIPARVSILVVGLYDSVLRNLFPKKRIWRGRWPGFLTVHSQALGMPSPNSGCSMNAFSWILKARMAGPSVYFGTLVEKPWLGPPAHESLPILICAMRGAGFFGMLFFWLILVLLCY